MALIEELTKQQIDTCLDEAIRRKIPLTMSCRVKNRWYSLHTRILKRDKKRLWLEYPTDEERPEKFDVGLALGLAFKLGHHKHIFTATIQNLCKVHTADTADTLRLICIPIPSRVQKVQRRAFVRVAVPASRSILVTFWLGGKDANQLVRWEGWMTNISAGGFQLRMPSRSAPDMNTGEIVGARIEVGQDYEPIIVDARLRSLLHDERGVALLGFQFLGLNDSQQGRKTLQRISRIVCSFQKIQCRRQVSA
ncbi:MAG: PilZ domain-containing protein [Planctomycetes bacterium]|nr:PilZ domain-containing protein [Planctomycetota bacterium]